MTVWRTPSLGMRCGEAKPASRCLMVWTPSDWADGSHSGLSDLGLPTLRARKPKGGAPIAASGRWDTPSAV
jgi:hypothetical protein